MARATVSAATSNSAVAQAATGSLAVPHAKAAFAAWRFSREEMTIVGTVDAIALVFAVAASAKMLHMHALSPTMTFNTVALAVEWLLLLAMAGRYRVSYARTAVDEVYCSLGASALVVIPASLLVLSNAHGTISTMFFGLILATAAVCSGLLRALHHLLVSHHQQRSLDAAWTPTTAVERRMDAILTRAFDLIAGTIALLAFSPILLAAMLAVALESPGGVIYRQRRVGTGGKTFEILKLRSMRPEAEASGAKWPTPGDGRVTRVGAFLRRSSIDELPQLINVLRGDMSLVGPRPERPEFVGVFSQEISRYDDRHIVRPGITGWAQVNMSRRMTIDQTREKLDHDLFYVNHRSLFLDLTIVTKTAAEVAFHRAG